VNGTAEQGMTVVGRAAGKRVTRNKIGIPSLVKDAKLSVQINHAARLTNQAARIRLGEIGAWPGQIPILVWLLEEDGIIQKDLVQRLEMDQSTVADHLTRMEASGLIRREQIDGDRRKFRIFLTEKGKSMSSGLLAELESGARLFMKGISNDEMNVFYEIMGKVIQNLEAFIKAAPRPPARLKPRAVGPRGSGLKSRGGS
jgi:DNA-binding MarR family transcriptional regulator